MPKLSAGILVFRRARTSIEVLLVHPGGPFWAKKNYGAWSIPKGEYRQDEEPQVAAKREFKEEIGAPPPAGELLELGEVKYGNKVLCAWAVEGDLDAAHIVSNTFEMEWPPKSGKTQIFAEVDKAQWCSPDMARKKLVKGQVDFVDRLLQKVRVEEDDKPADQMSLW